MVDRFTDEMKGGMYRNGRIISVVDGKEKDMGPVPEELQVVLEEEQRRDAEMTDVERAAEQKAIDDGLAKLFGPGWKA